MSGTPAIHDALTEIVQATRWIDTHEHLVEERHRLAPGAYRFTPSGEDEVVHLPQDWTALVAHYALDDMVSAGLSPAQARWAIEAEAEPLEKWIALEPYLQAARTTGYLHAVDLTTEKLFGLRLSRDTCEAIDQACRDLRRPGYYRHVIGDVAGIDRCQVNSLDANPFCESDMPDLLQQDLGLFPLVMGEHARAESISGIEVGDLDDYLELIDWCFDRYADAAVAVKCQWAYVRGLAVEPVQSPPRRAFARLRRGEADGDERRAVEDYLFSRCVALATQHGLPVKLHLGYLAGNREPRLRDLAQHVTQVTDLVLSYPETRFVLMHAAWPQSEQLIAVAKHCPNVLVDLCFAWIVAPVATADFVARFITAAPASKLLCFGGDYFAVEPVVGHAEIARRGLVLALERLVSDGWLSGDQALSLVPMLMRGNAQRHFKPAAGLGAGADTGATPQPGPAPTIGRS
jgi:hypothetical protein